MNSSTYLRVTCKDWSVIFRRFLCFLLILLPFFIALGVSTMTFYEDNRVQQKASYSRKLSHTLFSVPDIYDNKGHKEPAMSAWLFWILTFSLCGIVGKIEQHFYWKYRNQLYQVNEISSLSLPV